MDSIACSSPTSSLSSLSSSSLSSSSPLIMNSETNNKSAFDDLLSSSSLLTAFKTKNIEKRKIINSNDDLTLQSLDKNNIKSFNEIKQSLMNPLNGVIKSKTNDILNNDKENDDFRKRSNTWPIKKVELDLAIKEHDKRFAAKLIKELGLNSNKQLKNPWGNLSYSQLIEKAIESSTFKKLTLKEIYAWFIKFVPYFKDKSNYKSTMGWKNSIRHNLSLHKRFIRVPEFQRNSNTHKTSPKPIRFAWTTLKYKPKSYNQLNQNTIDYKQIKPPQDHENFFNQNANIFFNQNYNLNQYQLIDPTKIQFFNPQLAQLIKIFHQQNYYYLQQQQQQQQNLLNINNHNSEENQNQIKKKNTKCDCSSCSNNPITQNQSINFYHQQFLESQYVQQHQQSQIRYQIPISIAPTTSLVSIAPRLFYPKIISNNITNQNQNKETIKIQNSNNNVDAPFNFDENSNDEIIVDNSDNEDDYDFNMNNNFKNDNVNNDLSSYNYKRKLMDRFISEDENCFKKSNNENDNSKFIKEEFLKTNKISHDLIKFTEKRNISVSESLSVDTSSQTSQLSQIKNSNKIGFLNTVLK